MLRLFCSLFVLWGCADGDRTFEVSIDLKTDLLPGPEFDSAHIYLGRSLLGVVTFDRGEFGVGDSVRDGVRLIDVDDISADRHSLSVELHDVNGVVASREVSVLVDRDLALIVVITRDCREAMCPGDGSPRDVSCLGGRCVPPECVTGFEESCPPAECRMDTDCPLAAPCAVPRCDSAVCFLIPNHSLCDFGEYCDPNDGCLPEGEMEADAGMDASMDAGVDAMVDAAEDVAPDITEDVGPDPLCGLDCNPGPCAAGKYDCSGGSPVCVPETFYTRECRASTGPCDVAESCDGSTIACPVDGFAPRETACPEGSCDGAGACSGPACVLAITGAVRGDSVTSVADGNARCRAQFGADWDWVDWHYQTDWFVMCDWQAGAELGVSDRAWVWIGDQVAECHETNDEGLTWGRTDDGAGCHAPVSGGCDPFIGDTACTTSLPILCGRTF